MSQQRLRLGDTLVEAGLITQENLEKALVIQKERHLRLGTILLQEGFISEPQLLQALSRSLSIPWVSLWRLDIPDDVLRLVPLNVAEEFFLIPIYIRNEKSGRRALYVAMNDPSDEDAMRFVAASAGMDVRPMIAGPSDIAAAIRFYYYGEDVPQPPVVAPPPSTPPPAPAMPPRPPQVPARPAIQPQPEEEIEELHIESIQELAREDTTEKTSTASLFIHVEDKAMHSEAPVAQDAIADRFGDSVVPATHEEPMPEAPLISPPPGDPQENSSVEKLSEIMAERARFADKTAAQREAERRIYGVGRNKAPPTGFSLTLLDGTTISFGKDRKKQRKNTRMSRDELLLALSDIAAGKSPEHALPAEKWQSYVAVILKLLLDKHLLFFNEFIDELEKIEHPDTE